MFSVLVIGRREQNLNAKKNKLIMEPLELTIKEQAVLRGLLDPKNDIEVATAKAFGWEEPSA